MYNTTQQDAFHKGEHVSLAAPLQQGHDGTTLESTPSNHTPSSPPQKTSSPALRVLKRGDLVRMVHGTQSGTDRGLGRIVRVSNDKLDVEFVLGGRLSGVSRTLLVHTTADAEGLTQDSPRRQRRTTSQEPSSKHTCNNTKSQSVMATARKRKATTTKKTTSKRPSTTKKTTFKKPRPKAKRKAPPTQTKKPPAKKPKTKPKKPAKKNKTSPCIKPKQKRMSPIPQEESSTAVDLYARHLREFDRVLTRLEKTDPYGFFLGPPLEGFEEEYEQEVKFPKTPPFNWHVVRQRMEHGRYVLDRTTLHQQGDWSTTAKPTLLYPRGIHWGLFHGDVLDMCNAAISRDPTGSKTGTLAHAATKIKDAVNQVYERTGKRHFAEMATADAQFKYRGALQKNTEAAFQGNWRTCPFPERKYEKLVKQNVVCAGLSELDERSANYELQTSIPDSFVGLSYKFDDIGQSEGWMKSVLSETKKGRRKKDEQRAAAALAADNGVVRAQVRASMQTMLMAVQDRVMTEEGVLQHDELRSANWERTCDDAAVSENVKVSQSQESSHDNMEINENPSGCELVEQPVWGLDCYTRRNITMCLETEFTPEIAVEFVERWLLPAINACPVNVAHNIASAARILEGIPLEGDACNAKGRWSDSLLGKALCDKMTSSGPLWLRPAARELRLAVEAMGLDFFRVYPKGHGSVVLRLKGIAANTLVTFYRGEVYPAWRWCEKMDAIDITQGTLGVRPNLPDFYNMALERPQVDPRGYGLLFVDASRKAGHGSSLSHSCDPTCEVRVSAVKGQLCLAMTTLRDVQQGEELTFDYNAVTESLNEYRAAVCLCGHRNCRGSFLHFATADCYQQVLSRNSPIAVRLANLIKGCMKKVMSGEDDKVLANHGFGTAAFGAVGFNHHKEGNDSLDSMEYVPIWLRTFVADTLRYIEYERRALPISLLCNVLSTKDNSTRAQKDSKSNTSEMEKGKESKSKKDSGTMGETRDSSVVAGAPKRPKDTKPIPGSKPTPVFLFFALKQKDYFLSLLHQKGWPPEMNGAAEKRAVQTIAGCSWKALSEDRKQFWKEKALEEWERNGGKELAKLEEERKKRLEQCSASNEQGKDDDKTAKSTCTSRRKKDDFVCPSKISFETADAEGVAAMEQRIQQLTQTLSRVGRVLDRHRESSFDTQDALCRSSVTSAYLRSRIHSPVAILSDEHVVGWIWNHKDGVVRTLLGIIEKEQCVSPSLKDSIVETEQKYKVLRQFPNPLDSSETNIGIKMSPAKGRRELTLALVEFREAILKELAKMETDMKEHALAKARMKAHARRDRLRKKQEEEAETQRPDHTVLTHEAAIAEDGDVGSVVHSVLGQMVDSVVATNEIDDRMTTSEDDSCESDDLDWESEHVFPVVSDVLREMVDAVATRNETNGRSAKTKKKKSVPKDLHLPALGPWMKHFGERGKLAVLADLLLLYAHTSTFFMVKPYLEFDSTPIEVYARELGNSVPKSIMEAAKQSEVSSRDHVILPAENTRKEGQGQDCRIGSDKHDEQTAVSPFSPSPKAHDFPGGKIACDGSAKPLSQDLYQPLEGSVTERPEKENDSQEGVVAETLNDGSQGPQSVIEEEAFVPGARFNVLRKGKEKFCPGVVVVADFTGDDKRVLFHFPRMQKKYDEWVELDSSRIARIPVSSNPKKPVLINASSIRGGEDSRKGSSLKKKNADKANHSDFCEPDDIITNVVVKYQGDYVLSQLLQWYNGGIGQKPGMPDLMGCAMLPPISSCTSHPELDGTRKYARQTYYEAEVRPLLRDWFEDVHKRGNPWPSEIRDVFSTSTVAVNASGESTPFGSPIMDLLVTGDDTSIRRIVSTLVQLTDTSDGELSAVAGSKRRYKKSTAERLQSSVDVGRPAQAVANWVQCEDPNCLKWRKLPWHVDVDLLPDKFYCKDNIWNPEGNKCESPEDVWDERDSTTQQRATAQEKSAPGKKLKGNNVMPRKKAKTAGRDDSPVPFSLPGKNKIDKKEFVPGARFDVVRKGYRGKEKTSVGVVAETNLSDDIPRVKFHFPRMQAKFDEWIEMDSARISRLGTKTKLEKSPSKVAAEQNNDGPSSGTEKMSDLVPPQAAATTPLAAPATSLVGEKTGKTPNAATKIILDPPAKQHQTGSTSRQPAVSTTLPTPSALRIDETKRCQEGWNSNAWKSHAIMPSPEKILASSHSSPGLSRDVDMYEALKCLAMSPLLPNGENHFSPTHNNALSTAALEGEALEPVRNRPTIGAFPMGSVPGSTPSEPGISTSFAKNFQATKRHFGS